MMFVTFTAYSWYRGRTGNKRDVRDIPDGLLAVIWSITYMSLMVYFLFSYVPKWVYKRAHATYQHEQEEIAFARMVRTKYGLDDIDPLVEELDTTINQPTKKIP